MTSVRFWFLRTIHWLSYCTSQNVDISVHTFSSASVCITQPQCQPLPQPQPSILLPHTLRLSHLPCLIVSLTGTSGSVTTSLPYFVVVWLPEFPITRWQHHAFNFPLSELPWQLRNCLCQAPMRSCFPDSGRGSKKWYVRELRDIPRLWFQRRLQPKCFSSLESLPLFLSTADLLSWTHIPLLLPTLWYDF